MEYGCIGEHLPHSFSKEIHEKIGGYSYELKELAPEELPAFLQAKDFSGINVTIPYKQAVIPYLDEIDPMAAEIGAVNTIVKREGRLLGFNTDIIGMERLLQKRGITLAGKKVLILGTGGTSKTARTAARRAGAKQIITVSREKKDGAITYEEAYAEHADAAVLMNTTPCGMFPSLFAKPIDPQRFPFLTGVFDAVYNPLETQLVSAARKMGVNAECGLYMLVAQAVAAYEIFFGTVADAVLTDRIYAELLREKQSIVLIGMPGAGKSTVGKRIAEDTGRELIDTDALIEARAGTPIREIFAAKGEAYFRDLETEVIKDVAARSACVISTGGGSILRQENVDALKMNGRLYFLDRPPALLLPTDDRPLASSKEAILQRYAERYQKYLQAADAVIPVENDAGTAAEETERRHGYEIACH